MDELRLDGNAVRGLLREIFPFEDDHCAGHLRQLRLAVAGGAGDGLWTRHGYDRTLRSCDNALIRVGRAGTISY